MAVRTARLPTPDRALAIGAHPDDVEFGAGGTLAGWAADGCRVTIAVVTDGSKGTWDPIARPAEIAAIRWKEQQAAAEVLGAIEVVQLGYVDGELEYSMEVRAAVCGLIRRQRPTVVLSHDPWKAYELHPDHRATGLAVVDGALAARDHLFFPDQGLDAHRPERLLLWRSDKPDHWEDVQDSFATKVAALRAHESQHHTTMGGAGPAFEDELRREANEQGRSAGLKMAEAFKDLRL